MRKVFVSDITMKLTDGVAEEALSFRQKIELAKQLDKLGVAVIETGMLSGQKQDLLLVKALSAAIGEAALCVAVDIFHPENIETLWSALSEAAHPRLQVSVPVSTVQMEYLCHKKPEAIQKVVAEVVGRCAALCPDVEFVAEDFGRSDKSFLISIINTAVGAGANMVTIFDTAGRLLENECYESTAWIRQQLPADVRLGVWCSNEMYMADSCAIAAVRAGADEVKTTPYGNKTAALKRFVKILNIKSDVCQAECDVKVTEVGRAVEHIKTLCEADRKGGALTVNPQLTQTNDGTLKLTIHDDIATVMKVAAQLGYDLNDDDSSRVYEAVMHLASKNETVEAQELDAIVASVAFQAPPTYKLESYLINSGNLITASCHLRLTHNGELLETVCLGEGPVDAAFIAINQLTGRQYELDDFQIQSVTEGREAMGGTVVRLRHKGKVYSGRGVSRDIVGASIMAYLSAVNKIVYEEVSE